MTDLCDDGMHIADLLHYLRIVERSTDPGTDVKVIVLRTALCLIFLSWATRLYWHFANFFLVQEQAQLIETC